MSIDDTMVLWCFVIDAHSQSATRGAPFLIIRDYGIVSLDGSPTLAFPKIDSPTGCCGCSPRGRRTALRRHVLSGRGLILHFLPMMLNNASRGCSYNGV